MKLLLFFLGICGFLILVAYWNPFTAISDAVRTGIQTASGAIHDARNKVNTSLEPLVDTANTMDDKMKQIQEGVAEMKAGKKKVEDALRKP